MSGKKLTKAEIIEKIYPVVSVSKKNIHNILDLFFSELKNGLFADKVIELRGFGTFEIKMRKGRKARNPKTGETVQISPKKLPYFKCGKELKERVDY